MYDLGTRVAYCIITAFASTCMRGLEISKRIKMSDTVANLTSDHQLPKFTKSLYFPLSAITQSNDAK